VLATEGNQISAKEQARSLLDAMAAQLLMIYVHFREILSGYFLFSRLIGQYLSRNWLLNT
jgi:hypothetical protein